MDLNKTLEERARWELYKDAVCWFEQILEGALYKTAAIWSQTSHHTSKTCWAQKYGWTHKWSSAADSYI